jgi:DNA repair protein RadC
MENRGQEKAFTMRDLPISERPRERLQKIGADSLSVPELLAAILGRGIPGESVIKTAQRLLDRFETVHNMANATVEELSSIRGIGLAKACQLKAAFELANRLEKSSQNRERLVIKTPEEAYLELKRQVRVR